MINMYGFKQMIKKATRITKDTSTLIDIIVTNNESAISYSGVIPTCLSDHEMVYCTRKLNSFKYPAKTITCRDYSKYNKEELNRELENVDWNPIYDACNVNKALEYFNEIIKNIFDKHSPVITKRVKGRHYPWLNDEIKRTMNVFCSLREERRKTYISIGETPQ